MACCGPGAGPSQAGCCPPPAAATKESSCCAPGAADSRSGCCGDKAPAPASATNGAVTHDDVKEYYGTRVKQQADLQTSACLLQGGLTAEEKRLLGNVHEEILNKFYGCGSPIPPLLKGLTILDLGCGTGRDVYLAAQLVGEHGTAIGVDMTDEQLEVARKHEDWHRERFGFGKSNVSFRKGFIEDLKAAGVEDSSVDVVVSNCVVNLAPDKLPVLSEIARVLKPGGELYFSDVYADRRVPEHLRQDRVLFGECLSGALYSEDFRRLMARAGLPAWGVVSAREIAIENERIREALGDIRFFEATVRAVKLPPGSLGATDDALEDYGQTATYNGAIPGYESKFLLDKSRAFPSGVAVRVDATTASMLRESRYGPFFAVSEPGQHLGRFKKWCKNPASMAASTDLNKFCDSTAPVKICC